MPLGVIVGTSDVPPQANATSAAMTAAAERVERGIVLTSVRRTQGRGEEKVRAAKGGLVQLDIAVDHAREVVLGARMGRGSGGEPAALFWIAQQPIERASQRRGIAGWHEHAGGAA